MIASPRTVRRRSMPDKRVIGISTSIHIDHERTSDAYQRPVLKLFRDCFLYQLIGSIVHRRRSCSKYSYFNNKLHYFISTIRTFVKKLESPVSLRCSQSMKGRLTVITEG